MAAIIYRRQSLAKDGDELAIERQLTVCEQVAAVRGIEVADVITDNSVTASKRGRPGYGRLIKAIEAGAVDTVIILRVDRLLRLNDELEELIQLVEQRGLRVITCEGEVDLSTPQGRLIARILVSVARSEVEVKGARHRLANEQRAKSGKPHAGRRAYGYDYDGMTLREDEALVLKEVGQRFINGWSYTELAYWMNQNGYTTTMGNPFYSVAVRQMLQRKRYVGIREYDGVEYEARWPAIFDEDTWTLIQRRIRERSASVDFRPMPRRYLLTGLLICGICGGQMNGTTTYDRRTGEPRKTYRCNRMTKKPGFQGCGKVSRGAVPVDWFVRECIIYRLDSPELGQILGGQNHFGVSTELVQRSVMLNAKLESLLDDYTDGTLTKTEYKRAKERVNGSLEAVRRELEKLHFDRTLNGLVASGESVRERWLVEGTGWRRGVVELLVESITIQPSLKKPQVQIGGRIYKFDAAAVEILWKV